ncbi:MAG: BatD family protein [Bacteroidales bacterium]|nr:BatD family protein [Bacteroidales bacterium]
MKILVSLLLLFILPVLTIAQDITVTVEAPGVVAVGEQFRVVWTVSSRGGSFTAPGFDDFYLLSGPQTSFSSSTSIINGKVTSEVKNSFTYYLQATRTGNFTLGPGIYTEGREDFSSKQVEIEVIESRDAAAARNNNQETAGAGAAVSDAGEEMFLRVLIDRNRVYMGEHIVATLKLYSESNLSGIRDYKFPDFSGFLKEDIETPQVTSLTRENVNGEIYGTAVLQRYLLFPQRTGTIEINPASLTVLVQERVRSNDPFFGDFFSSFNTVPRMISSDAVKITVQPLPAGAPASFSGAVGNFTLETFTDRDSVKVNDAITYTIRVAGNGNLRLIPAPDISLSPDIEAYEPKTASAIRTTTSGSEGSRTFEYLLIPRYHGNYNIPPFEFSWFDPDQKRYMTARSSASEIVVTKSDEEQEGTEIFGGRTGGDVRYLGSDIRHIWSDPGRFRIDGETMLSGNRLYLTLLVLLVLFFLIILLRREQIKRNADLARVRNRKAARIASNRFKVARTSLKNSDFRNFYSDLLNALWGYLGDKLAIPLSDLKKENVMTALLEKSGSEELTSTASDLIDICEYNRYAPSGGNDDPAKIYDMAVELIKRIEKKV